MPRLSIPLPTILMLTLAAGCARAPDASPEGGSRDARAAEAGAASLQPVIADFAARLEADVAADSVGSIAAAVVADGRVVWEDAFGLADVETATPATPETIYRVGSITKTVTAVLLMRLVTAGVVRLDDPVAMYVPEIEELAGRAPDSGPITLRHLATHTAGLAREPSSSRAARGQVSRWERNVIASIPLTEALTGPGERYRYSNIGYAILGLALERAAGRPFEDLVTTFVLEPLGMRNSTFVVPGGARSRLAAGYVNPPGVEPDPRVPRAEHRGRGYKVPNEGLYSTVGDLARLILALVGHPDHAILGGDARAAMLTDQTPGRDAPVGYGIGLQLTRIGDTLLAGHSGRVAGYASYLVFDPATGVGVVLVRNYNRGATNLAAEAQRVVLDLTGPSRGRGE